MNSCPLDEAALLIIDMQQHFASCATPLVPRLNTLVKAARAVGMPVIWTQHGHPDPVMDAATSNLVRWWGPENSIEVGSDAWQLLPALDVNKKEDIIIDDKRTYDALHGTRLSSLLEEGIRAVIIGGVMTELCCETTARSAFVKGYDVFFLSDGTGTDDKSHHDATLRALEFGFATIVECEEVADNIDHFKAGGGKGFFPTKYPEV